MATRKTLTKPSRRDVQEMNKRLRYMDPTAVAKDFPGKGERAAIAAVFEWLALNSIVAVRRKDGTYRTRFSVRQLQRAMDKTDAIVMDDATYERARQLLVPEKGRRSGGNP